MHSEFALVTSPIDVPGLLARAGDPAAGAVLSFVGTVRNAKQGRRVLRIEYEAYEPMARKVLERIGAEMAAGRALVSVALVHRIGRVEVGEASIAIVVATAHRAAGFEALRHGIEAVKRDLPVWKHEFFEDGAVWVQEGS